MLTRFTIMGNIFQQVPDDSEDTMPFSGGPLAVDYWTLDRPLMVTCFVCPFQTKL